jgi:hypothetical protein
MDLLTLLIVLLVVAWLFGGFVFPVGNAIHLLLVVILVIVVVRLAQGRGL